MRGISASDAWYNVSTSKLKNMMNRKSATVLLFLLIFFIGALIIKQLQYLLSVYEQMLSVIMLTKYCLSSSLIFGDVYLSFSMKSMALLPK